MFNEISNMAILVPSLIQCGTVLMKVQPILCNDDTVMTDKAMVILQHCVDSLEVVPGSYCETYLISSRDENEAVSIKVESETDIQEEKDPLMITVPVIKTKHEVSCMSVCTYLFRVYMSQLRTFLLHGVE
jgi:hypothetical protein